MRLRASALMAACRSVITAIRAAWGVLGAMLIAGVLLAAPAGTSANSSCTDTWTGGAGTGLWQTAGNWSTGSVPGAGDVACVGAGVTVNVTAGANQAAALQDEGGLSISGGSLELASALETSTVSSLSLAGGTLSVAGELDVSSSLAVTGNPVTVSGAGRLVVAAGATGTIGSTGCSAHPALSGVTLVNKGSLTFGASAGVGAGAVAMQNGAQFKNEGTFTDRSYDEGCGYGVGGNNYSFYNTGGSTSIVNTGTFQAEGGSQTLNIDVAFTNQGTVKALSGTLRFIAGGSGASSTWSAASGSTLSFGTGSYALGSDTFSGAGTISVNGVTVTATGLQSSAATASVASGNRLKSETGPNGSVEYSYDAAGQRQSVSLDGETLASYAHNLDGQLIGISTPNGNVALSYDQDGRRTRTVLPNGDSESYTYNQASQLAGISYQNPAGEAIGDLQYARDALGRISAISGSLARTSLHAAVSEASYDAANELTNLNGQTLTYDADGNLAGEGATSYSWNDRNQLTGVTKGEETSSWSAPRQC